MCDKVLNKQGLRMYFGLENELGEAPYPPPLTANKLSYARHGIAREAQRLRAFLLHAIDLLSDKMINKLY